VTHQWDYLVGVLLVIYELLVNIVCTGCMPQSRVKKSLFDKANGKGGIGKHIDEDEQGTENVKGIPDHQADQGMLHGEHEPICVWR